MTDVGPQPADPERALVEAIASLDDVDPASVAGLLDDRLDASVASRSSHDDPDPEGRIDNLDKSISALNDLAQSDILSDGQPFDGANVDAAVSSRATPADSVDWAAKTPQTAFSLGSEVSVSGSGFIIGVQMAGDTTGNSVLLRPIISVDGSTLLRPAQYGGAAASGSAVSISVPLFFRFESDLSVDPQFQEINNGTMRVVYVLD